MKYLKYMENKYLMKNMISIHNKTKDNVSQIQLFSFFTCSSCEEILLPSFFSPSQIETI